MRVWYNGRLDSGYGGVQHQCHTVICISLLVRQIEVCNKTPCGCHFGNVQNHLLSWLILPFGLRIVTMLKERQRLFMVVCCNRDEYFSSSTVFWWCSRSQHVVHTCLLPDGPHNSSAERAFFKARNVSHTSTSAPAVGPHITCRTMHGERESENGMHRRM